MSDTALVVFTPSGKRGRFALGTPLLEIARTLGVDVDSVCGGRGLCGRCQVTIAAGRVRQARHPLGARPRLAVQRRREALPRPPPARQREPPQLPGAAAGRRRGRRPGREPGPQAGREETRRGPGDRARPGGPPALRRGRRARHGAADRRPPAPAGGAARAVAAGRADLRPAGAAEPAEGAPPGRLEGHGRGPLGQPDHRRLAGLSAIAPTASRSTSARPPSPAICAISRAAR